MEVLKTKSAKINYEALDALFSNDEKRFSDKSKTGGDTPGSKGPDTEDEEETRVRHGGYVSEEAISDYDDANW
jgi:hypothetical protein